jgi:FMN phosphatase YigB (HAD superfamily)
MSGAATRLSPGSAFSRPADLLAALQPYPRVVFDLDGTIYDARDFERPALAAVAAWLRDRSGRELPGIEDALWSRRERDRHAPGLFDEQLVLHGLPAEWGAGCRERFHAHGAEELGSAASLRALLEALVRRGTRLALVSNGPPALQQRKLERLGLAGAFEVRVFCDPSLPERLKPSRWAWQQLAGWRGADEVAYVGDDAVDAAFADAGNARFFHFRFRSPTYAD